MNSNSENTKNGHSPSLDPEVIENRLNAWLAEYQALRSEMEWLIRDGTQRILRNTNNNR